MWTIEKEEFDGDCIPIDQSEVHFQEMQTLKKMKLTTTVKFGVMKAMSKVGLSHN